MILEDEILKDGDVVKLVAVISGGAGVESRESRVGPRLTALDSPLSNNGSL
jgi:hypothetical protein